MDEAVEAVARTIAKANGLDFDEVCGVDADPDEGYCDSSTCVAACFEDHDAEWARKYYRHEAQAAIAAMESFIQTRIAAAQAAILEEAAGIAKIGWVTADYDVVGIADADMAMRLCEHIETAIRAAGREGAK